MGLGKRLGGLWACVRIFDEEDGAAWAAPVTWGVLRHAQGGVHDPFPLTRLKIALRVREQRFPNVGLAVSVGLFSSQIQNDSQIRFRPALS